MKTIKKYLGLFLVPVVLLSGAAVVLSQEEATDNNNAEYRICAGDLLEITVYNEPDLTQTERVTNAGTINCALVGTVAVSGMTAEEVEQRLDILLSEGYLVNPQASVLIREYAKVYVMGQVKKPGAYELKSNMTVVEAVALAGGLTDIASPNGTKIIRKKEGKETVINVPLDSILRSGSSSSKYILEKDDTVVVPETLF